MLTADMKRVIREQRLGFVATVNPDGTPNVSPKATFVVIDDATIGFGDIRSPGTLRNLKSNPAIEVNFVDPFIWSKLTAGIEQYMQRHGVRRVSDLVGSIDTSTREKEWVSS